MNAVRCKRKLPSLLVDGSTTRKENFNRFFLMRRKLNRLEKGSPERYNTLMVKYIAVLNEIKSAIEVA